MVEGEDYDWLGNYTATPTACSIRLFANTCISLALMHADADVVKAFTLATLDRRICVQQPYMDFTDPVLPSPPPVLNACCEPVRKVVCVSPQLENPTAHP